MLQTILFFSTYFKDYSQNYYLSQEPNFLQVYICKPLIISDFSTQQAESSPNEVKPVIIEITSLKLLCDVFVMN